MRGTVTGQVMRFVGDLGSLKTAADLTSGCLVIFLGAQLVHSTTYLSEFFVMMLLWAYTFELTVWPYVPRAASPF